jgi:HAD superfamily hydrolase (TIGR01549 family)
MISHNLAKIKGLLVDFDGTLVDFKKSQDNAFKLIMKDYNVYGEDIETLREKFLEFDAQMWNFFEKRELTIKEVQRIRFQKLIDYFPELTADAWEINQRYLRYLINETEYFDGVLDSLKKLRECRIKIVIISNGVDWTQKERLKKLDLNSLIDGLLTSEGVGFSKPHPAIFEEGMKILNMPKSNVLVIGDNPNADIRGAHGVGLSACLITDSQSDFKYEPEFIANSFTEFSIKLLENIEK